MIRSQDTICHEYIRPEPINETSTRFDLIINKAVVAYIIIRRKQDTYGWIKDFCSEDFYNKLVPDSMCLSFSQLLVKKEFRNEGYANKLMKKLDEILPRYYPNYSRIILYVYPTEFNIPVDTLRKFYTRFGFKSIKFPKDYIKNVGLDQEQIEDSNRVMIRNIRNN